nr:polyprotein [Bat picornavirus BtSY8]
MEAITNTFSQEIKPVTDIVKDVEEVIVGPLAMISAQQETPKTGFDTSSAPAGVNSGITPDLYIANFSKPALFFNGTHTIRQEAFTQISNLNITKHLREGDKPFTPVAKMWRYYRADFKFVFQANVAAGGTGALLFVFVPEGYWENRNKWSKATLFNLPHAILNYGHQTQATLTVPFVSHNSYYSTARDTGPTLMVWSLCPYNRSDGMQSEVDFVIFCALENLSFSQPLLEYQSPERPPPEVNERSHSTRFKWHEPFRVVKESDGVANLANSHSTGSNISTALAGERIYLTRNTLGGIGPVRDLLDIAKIPSAPIDKDTGDLKVESTFEWLSSKPVGDMIFNFAYEIKEMGNLGFIARHYAAFSGTINLELMAFSSKLHQGRVAIVVQHEPGEGQGRVTLSALSRVNYHVLDLTSQSSITVKIPYMWPSWMREVNEENYIRIFVVVLNRLATSSVAVNKIKFLIRFSAGDDFRYHFPAEDSIVVQNPTSWGSEMDLLDPIEDEESSQHGCCVPEQQDIDQMKTPDTFGKKPSMYKVSAISYTALSQIMGRAMFITDNQYQASTSSVHVALHIPKSGHGALLHYFAYWNGEINITISNDSDNNIVASHSYKQLSGRLEGSGVVVIPARRIVTFTAPFYSTKPVRLLVASNDNPVFGHLHVNPGYNEGSFKVWVSLRNPNFFFPTPNHITATTASYLDEIELYNPTLAEAHWNLKRYNRGIDKVKISNIRPTSGISLVKEHMQQHKDLLLSGDIEENPGPEYEQVYKHRGLYKHYGIETGGKVYHLNTEDILWSAATGKAEIIVSEMDGSWVRTGIKGFNPQEPDVGARMQFSLNSNCETFADDFIGYNGWDQGQILTALASFIFTASLFTHMDIWNQDASGVFSALTEFITNTMTNTIVSRVLKFLLRMVLYAVLFSHAPCIATGGSIIALLTMDLFNLQSGSNKPWVKGFFKAAMAGDVAQMVENISDGIEDEDEQEQAVSSSIEHVNLLVKNQGFFDDFNKATLSFKNVEWWYKIIVELYERIKEKFKPSEATRFAKVVRKQKSHLADLLTTVAILKDKSKDQRQTASKEFKELYSHVSNLIQHWLTGFANFAPKHELYGTLQAAQRTLQTISFSPEIPAGVARVEPLGVVIRGDPGAGKSFFSTLLSKFIRQKMGWSNDQVYTHPVGSEHMDGYNGQKIHLIDDMGQNADDEEYKFICQMISTVHFKVPMAHLENKGTFYTSEIVIATTNRYTFSTKTVNFPEALQRRFPYAYTIRPRKECSYGGKLDVATSMDQMKRGLAWEDEQGTPLDVEVIADKITRELKAKQNSVAEWDNFVNQGPLEFDSWKAKVLLEACRIDEELFGHQGPQLLTATEKFTLRVRLACERFGECLKRNIHWITFLSALTGIIAVVAYFVQKKFAKEEQKEQVYQGNPTMVKKKTNFQPKQPGMTENQPIVNQSPLDDKMHLRKVLVRLVADRVQVFGLAIGGTKILTYGHAKDLLFKSGEVYVVYGDKKELLTEPTFQQVMVNGKETDLAIVDTKLGFAMANGTRFVTNQMQTEGALLWNTKDGLYMQEVTDIRPLGESTTANGTYSHDSFAYKAMTSYGTCGGMLIVKEKGIWKILGMHIAGNGMIGRAVAFPPFDQGVYHPIESLGLPPVNMPKKTKLRESPAHGVFPVEKGPAALTKRDPRVEEGHDPYDQIVLKNVGNVFQLKDPDRFREAWMNVRSRLSYCIGKHEPLDTLTATFELANPIDMSSSPGFKYTSQNFRKKDLIDTGKKEIHPLLHEDVEHMMKELESGPPTNYFTTAFKDELRTEKKIKEATTRVIEASNLDYVICFRRLFGIQQDIICATPALETGIAMGINPYKDWTELVMGLWDNNYCFDYTKFDGSLSDQLMGYAGMVMASLTTEPDKLMNLLSATIWSTHHGPRGDYYLKGSNPSGTPFTTVLNCICNLIIVEYFMIGKGEYVAVTYGDDLILSTRFEVDPKEFQAILKEEFGMNITPERKEDTGFRNSKPMETSFLKRTPRCITPTTIVGVLDVENMKQCIMWCRGQAAFKQQLNSFILELALHGRQTYEKISDQLRAVGVRMPDFDAAWHEVLKVIYD